MSLSDKFKKLLFSTAILIQVQLLPFPYIANYLIPAAEAAFNHTLVDFGATETENDFSQGLVGWDSVIMDKYSTNRSLTAPGSSTTHSGINWSVSNTAAVSTGDYQGLLGNNRDFHAGEKIMVAWYNHSALTFVFTPRISFDDPNRINETYSGGDFPTDGTWYDMSQVTMTPYSTAVSTFEFSSAEAGSYKSVNVHLNLPQSTALQHEGHYKDLIICKKIVYTDTYDTNPPTAISGLQASAISENTIWLSWNASVDDAGVPEYRVYQNDVVIGSTQDTDYFITNLVPETSHNFKIITIDETGNESGFSTSISATTRSLPDLCWQQTLEPHFDIVDTFDHYNDWFAEAGTLPQKHDQSPSIWGGWDDQSCFEEKPYDRDLKKTDNTFEEHQSIIGDHGPERTIGSKSIWLSYGRGVGYLKHYFGDPELPGETQAEREARSQTGYDEMYAFFRFYRPRTSLPTRDPSTPDSNRAIIIAEKGCQGRVVVDYIEGQKHAYAGGKFFMVGSGFTGATEFKGIEPAPYLVRYGWLENWSNISIGGNSFPVDFSFDNYYTKNPYPGMESNNMYKSDPTFSSAELEEKKNFIKDSWDKMIGIEYYMKLENPAGCIPASDDDPSCEPGLMKAWIYDENGNSTLFMRSNRFRYRPAYGEYHYGGVDYGDPNPDILNRIMLEGNYADINAAGNKYEAGPNMEDGFYMDDYILVGKNSRIEPGKQIERIGPRYFDLLHNHQPCDLSNITLSDIVKALKISAGITVELDGLNIVDIDNDRRIGIEEAIQGLQTLAEERE